MKGKFAAAKCWVDSLTLTKQEMCQKKTVIAGESPIGSPLCSL
jgi:hypothetical protein